ncbi:hypothetical protein NC652_010301 [Populus alba x Populus x berolinensis]|nr:hypothetical protein NC652_010301 [Populus alba x Populus x berolinensis]
MDLIVECQKFRGQVENGHFKKTVSFLNPLFSAFFLAQRRPFQQEFCNCRSWDMMESKSPVLFLSSTHGRTWLTPKIIIHVLWFYKSQRKNKRQRKERKKQLRNTEQKKNHRDEYWPSHCLHPSRKTKKNPKHQFPQKTGTFIILGAAGKQKHTMAQKQKKAEGKVIRRREAPPRYKHLRRLQKQARPFFISFCIL